MSNMDDYRKMLRDTGVGLIVVVRNPYSYYIVDYREL